MTAIPFVHAETGNLNTCYTSLSSTFVVVADWNQISINLDDNDVKLFFTNLCNFYHDKLGQWITMRDAYNIDPQLLKDFYNLHHGSIPESIITLWHTVD